MQARDLFKFVENHTVNILNEEGIKDDEYQEKQIIDLVIKYIPSYSEFKSESVVLNNKSGGGGGFAWHVSVENSECEPLLVHARHRDLEKDPGLEGKMEAFQKVQYENGLSTPRYISGDNWWIEPYYETIEGEKILHADMGTLLAKIHKCPTDWYSPFREQLKKIHPALREASDNSWIYGILKSNWMREHCFDDPFVQKRFIEFDKFVPRSEAGKRIVCKHGDFHPGNLLNLKSEKKQQAVDFEFSSVGYAAQDLGFVTLFSDEPSLRTLLEAYLIELGYPTDKKAIDDLLIDVRFGSICALHGVATIDWEHARANPENFLSVIPRITEIYNEVETNDSLRNSLFPEHIHDFQCKDSQYKEIMQKRKAVEIDDWKSYVKRKFNESISREKFDELLEKAKQKGIIKIDYETALSYNQVKKLAEERNCDLCTRQELVDAGFCVFNFTFNQYIKREDGEKGLLQLGKEFYQATPAGHDMTEKCPGYTKWFDFLHDDLPADYYFDPHCHMPIQFNFVKQKQVL